MARVNPSSPGITGRQVCPWGIRNGPVKSIPVLANGGDGVVLTVGRNAMCWVKGRA